MPKEAHSEEQIVAVLRQGEAGEKVADICCRVGISDGTYYMWKKQYAGLGIVSKQAVTPGRRRKLGQWAQQTFQIGQRRAARLVRVAWTTWLYKRKVWRFDAVLRRRLCEMAASHVRYGYRRLTVLLRRDGWKVNAKPHFDGGGPVHSGVRLFGSGSCHDRNASSPGAGESQSRARRSAGQHYGGQWQ